MNPQIVVVGSFVQDLTWRCAEFPRPGQTVVGPFATAPGGKGSNQAVAASRAGAATCFVGAVGCDAFGAAARKFYRAEGIAARFAEKPGHATGTAGIIVSATGENEIVVAIGANLALARSDIDAGLIRGARVLVTQLESNLAATAFALRTARRAGVTTVLNAAPWRPDFDAALLADVDVLIPNESEFAALASLLPATAGAKPFTEAALLALDPADLHGLCRRIGVPAVIVTLGARGCFISQARGFTRLPAHAVRAIDTTGAGDAFVGGFAAGLVKNGGDILDAARFGNAVAALSVTRFGTACSMPQAREISRFLHRNSKALLG
jgi:ribokinase